MEVMYKTGIFVGKFLPPHIGHLNQIFKCKDMCETLFVIVADSKIRSKQICNDAGIKIISAKTRLKWLKKCTKSVKNIKYLLLDEGMLEAYQDHLENWKNKLNKILKQKVDVWFVDKNYLDISQKYFPEYNFVGFDRSEINISATEIRNNLEENLSKIISPAQKYFRKNFKIN